MLTNADSLLDQMIEILWKIGRETLGLQHTQNLIARHESDLGNTVRVTQDDADLRWSETLLGQLVDLLFHIFCGKFEPLNKTNKNIIINKKIIQHNTKI